MGSGARTFLKLAYDFTVILYLALRSLTLLGDMLTLTLLGDLLTLALLRHQSAGGRTLGFKQCLLRYVDHGDWLSIKLDFELLQGEAEFFVPVDLVRNV